MWWTYSITDSSCGSKSKWALVHLCTCKAAANRSNVYVSGKNNKKILPIPETMQSISTSAESKEERSKKNKNIFGWRNLLLTFLSDLANVCYTKICKSFIFKPLMKVWLRMIILQFFPFNSTGLRFQALGVSKCFFIDCSKLFKQLIQKRDNIKC